MIDERVFDNSGMLYVAHLDALADAARKLQSAGCKPVRIFDIATGPNGFNPAIVKRLVAEGIDYRLALSAIYAYGTLERIPE